jgi:hypothetical protein
MTLIAQLISLIFEIEANREEGPLLRRICEWMDKR